MDRSALLVERSTGLVQRLFDAFAKQVDDIERRISQSEPDCTDDVKVLSGLARTLETLMDLEQKTASTDNGPDIDKARDELQERISRLLAAHGGETDASSL